MSAAPAGPGPASPPGPSPARGGTPWTPVLWVLAVGGAAAVVYLFRSLAVPVIFATLLAYLLSPLVLWLQTFAVRRAVAVALVFGAIALVLLGAGYLAAPRIQAEGAALVERLPPLIERGTGRAVRELTEAYPALGRRIPRVLDREGWLIEAIEGQAGHAADLLGRAGSLAFVGVLTPIFSFFMLRDGGRMLRYILDHLHPRHVETSLAVWSEIDEIIGRYLRGVSIVALIVGLLAWVGLWLIGVPYPMLLGAFTALVNPIPYLCTVLGISAAAIVALASGQGLGIVIWIVLLYVAIRLLDDLVITVLVIGKSVHLHPMLVLASILAGEHALGILGMVIAVPLVTVVKETVRLLLEHRRTLQRAPAPAPRRVPEASHYVC